MSVAGLVLVVVAAALLILLDPGLVINDRALAWAQRFARTHGEDVRWTSAHVEVGSRGLLRKAITFRFEGLCVNLEAGLVTGCFDRLDVSAIGGLEGLVHPRLSDVGPVLIRGGRVAITPPPPRPGARPSASEGPLIPEFLASALVHPVTIDMPRLEIEGFAGSLELTAKSEGSASVIHLDARAPTRDQLGASARLERRGALRMKDFERLDGWAARFAAQARLSGRKGRAEARGNVSADARAARFDLTASYRLPSQEGREIHAHLRGELRERGLRATLDAEARHLAAALPSVRAESCQIALEAGARLHQMESTRHGGGHLSLDCPLAADVRLGSLPRELARQLPRKAGALLKAELDTESFPPSPSERLAGSVDFQITPSIRMPLFEMSGGFSSTVNGVATEFPEGLHHDTRVALRLAAPKFSLLARELERSRFAVWAPLRVLDGSLGVDLAGRLDTDKGTLPFRVTTRLSSPSQKFDVDADGQLALSGLGEGKVQMHASADVALSDFQLELPRLDLKAPPRLFPDSRIGAPEGKKQEAGTAPSPFTYDFLIHTVKGGPPARILVNLAQKAIPIRLNLRIVSDKPLGGVVEVRDFPVEFFRRKATVDHFNIMLASPTPDSKVDGAVRIKYTDYVVTVIVVGTVDKPQIELASVPALTQDEIVSVLLYGRTMDELDQDQTSSVSSTQAAVADRALGLLSLYALASTPIQSVGYDPTTGQVLVKVRLAQGTSLNLGSQPGGLQDIGIRKNLGSHWAISTDLNPPAAVNSNRSVVSAFLEWSARY